jgi:hypothetical protein
LVQPPETAESLANFSVFWGWGKKNRPEFTDTLWVFKLAMES